MIIKENERYVVEERNAENGYGMLYLEHFLLPPDAPAKQKMYAKATLEPGAMVGFHKHTGESESYYILSGTGEYNDEGKISTVSAGMVTFTPSGYGHSIKNIGTEPLVFIALIIREDL